jgi:hypothetical protein
MTGGRPRQRVVPSQRSFEPPHGPEEDLRWLVPTLAHDFMEGEAVAAVATGTFGRLRRGDLGRAPVERGLRHPECRSHRGKRMPLGKQLLRLAYGGADRESAEALPSASCCLDSSAGALANQGPLELR